MFIGGKSVLKCYVSSQRLKSDCPHYSLTLLTPDVIPILSSYSN